jgi:hypothetical protein
MTDVNGNVRGIRLRALNGRKFAVRGGREGLFIPADVAIGTRLFVAEGPSDVCAGLDLGLSIIGRPSCMGGIRMIVELVQNRKPREVIVVADADHPGPDGAELLAKTLLDRTQAAVRVVVPPDGIKDLRDWKATGATVEDVEEAVGRAELRRPIPLSIRRAQKHALENRVRSPKR